MILAAHVNTVAMNLYCVDPSCRQLAIDGESWAAELVPTFCLSWLCESRLQHYQLRKGNEAAQIKNIASP